MDEVQNVQSSEPLLTIGSSFVLREVVRLGDELQHVRPSYSQTSHLQSQMRDDEVFMAVMMPCRPAGGYRHHLTTGTCLWDKKLSHTAVCLFQHRFRVLHCKSNVCFCWCNHAAACRVVCGPNKAARTDSCSVFMALLLVNSDPSVTSPASVSEQ